MIQGAATEICAKTRLRSLTKRCSRGGPAARAADRRRWTDRLKGPT